MNIEMVPFYLKVKTFFIHMISYVFGGFPVYVKDPETGAVTVKRARPLFDPFTNNATVVVKLRKYGLRHLNNNGTIGSSESWQWQHVNPENHAMHVLQHK